MKYGRLLGAFDLLSALAAIITGTLMIGSNYGIFKTYPKEWLAILPFRGWFVPGVMVIVLFGAGNIIAAFLSFRSKSINSWLFSALMGGLLFISLTAQVIAFRACYLATMESFIFSIVQLCLSRCVYAAGKHNK